jgi:hypothetical protein
MASDGLHARVTVEGFQRTITELKKFDAKAYRRMNSSIRQEMAVLEQTAKGFVSNASRSWRGTPLSGWRDVPAQNGRTRGGAGWPAWNEGEIKAGISRTTAQGRVDVNYRTNLYGLKNKSAAGVIFETAGRNNKLSPFNRKIANMFRPARRIVYRAVWEDRGDIQRKIVKIMQDTIRETNQGLRGFKIDG